MSCQFHDMNHKILEIKKCETVADTAWNSFRQDLIDCISSIELLKCQLKLISENNNSTNNNDILLNCCKKGETESLSKKAALLNDNLQVAIKKSSTSIRRSFLAYNSLISQHELLFLPYFEMKEYYKQLQDFAKSEILAPKEKLSYGEALEDLMYLSKDIHQTKTRTEQLQDNSHTSVPSS